MTSLLESARKGAVLVGRPERETLVVTGPERQRWLNGLVTCDAALATAGAGTHGLVLSRTGRIQSDVEVIASPGSLLVGLAAGTGSGLAEAFDKMLVMEDAEVTYATAQWAWVFVHGARAQELAEEVVHRVAGAVFARIEWTRLGGGALVVPRQMYDTSLRIALEQGSGWAIGATPEQWDVLRLETGCPEFGVDYGPQQTPHEASLERRAVAWNKGCYLGQEVVCKQDTRGTPRWRLAPIVLDSTHPPLVGTPVHAWEDEQLIGEITSSALSSELGKAIAMARLKSAFSREGSALRVDACKAIVAARPLGL